MALRRTLSGSVFAGCLLAALGLMSAAALAAGPQAGATRLGPAPPSRRISLVLPLKADLARLQQFATAVSTAGAAQYGQFEPIPTLSRRFGASAATRERVLSYLRRQGAGAVKIDATGLFADATMNVAQAQHLFGTSLASFATANAQSYIAPTGSAHVPGALNGAVTGVVGLDTQPLFNAPQPTVAGPFPRIRSHGFHADFSSATRRTGTPSGCAGALAQRGFTPNQYLTAYNYAALHGAGITGQGERVALIEIDGFRPTDLRAFAGCFGFGVPAIDGFGVGLRRPLAPGGESTLDLELLDAAAPGLKHIDVYESRSRAADVLRSLTAPLQNRGRTPEVISASLGTCEPALLHSVGFAGLRSAEGGLAAAAASGISVTAASGDAGSTACIGRKGPIDARAVSYPASSPFVTGVGGTNIQLSPANTITAQTVWNDAPVAVIAAGGGRSALFPRPSYQKGSVKAHRRTVPDVSLLADLVPGYDIYCTARRDCLNKVNPSNPWVAVGGTSAAAPLLAGGLALVDQVLRAHGRQQLGNPNSLLYKIARSRSRAAVFSDVTTNNNDLGPFLGRHRRVGCCTAHPGYDAASGLGSVNLAALAFVASGVAPRIAKVSVSLPRQHPLARHRLLARVFCSRHCLAGSLAVVTGGSRAFVVRSGIYLLRRRGSRQIRLGLSKRELRELHRGRRAHKKLYATIFGVIVDSSANIERFSSARRLRIG